MFSNFDAWAAALFTFLGVVITGLFGYITSKGKQANDNNNQLFQHTFTQLGMLTNRIEVLEKEREELLDELKDLMDELNTIKLENAELKAENRILRERLDQFMKKSQEES